MIAGLSVLGMVTARGGSEGLARKNLCRVGGRSLLERALTVGREAATVDRVILSSEDPEIIQTAMSLGCDVPFVRPPELATAEARSVDVVRHALANLPERYDLVVLLQPTSPLRTAADVDAAVELCVRRDAPACVSVTPAEKPPFWMFRLDERQGLEPILPDHVGTARRQALPTAYAINGAVYVARSDWIMTHDSFVSSQTVGYIMPKARSIDVDDELDLVLAEALENWSSDRAETDGEDHDRLLSAS